MIGISMTKIEAIHDGRSDEHSYPSHILRDPCHQVTRIVPPVKTQRKCLVMIIHFILQIIFDMAGHHNDGLPDQKKKKSPQQGHPKDDQSIDHHAVFDHIVIAPLYFRSLENPVNLQVIHDKIQCIPYKLSRQYLENVGDNDKKQPQQKMEFILIEILV
jgi:hypothetical protein